MSTDHVYFDEFDRSWYYRSYLIICTQLYNFFQVVREVLNNTVVLLHRLWNLCSDHYLLEIFALILFAWHSVGIAMWGLKQSALPAYIWLIIAKIIWWQN